MKARVLAATTLYMPRRPKTAAALDMVTTLATAGTVTIRPTIEVMTATTITITAIRNSMVVIDRWPAGVSRGTERCEAGVGSIRVCRAGGRASRFGWAVWGEGDRSRTVEEVMVCFLAFLTRRRR